MKEKQNTKNFAHHTTSITIASDRAVAPYIDTFAITPQNIIEREHGSLVGFFRIYDESEDSAYIANFLTSVLKKEFYASTRRDTETALEAALAKVNMALGELARHNNAQWVGKVDGAVCVFTHTSVCFSSCGHGSIQLFRNDALTQISLPTTNDTAHVLSTFSDIACGPLHAHDTFIIASREFASVLSPEECERACMRYTHTEREQLFRTALVNQTNGSCVHLVEVTAVRASIARRAATFDVTEEAIEIPENVFSAETFTSKEVQKNTTPSTDNTEVSTGTFQDKIKDTITNHIYLRGDETDTHNTPFGAILMEHTTSLRHALRQYTQTTSKNIRNSYATACKTSTQKTRALSTRTCTVAQTSFLTALHIAQKAAQRARTSIAQIYTDSVERYIVYKQQKSQKNQHPLTTSSQTSPENNTNQTYTSSTQKQVTDKKTDHIEKKLLDTSPSLSTPRIRPSFTSALSKPLTTKSTLAQPDTLPSPNTDHTSALENFLTRNSAKHTSKKETSHTYSFASILGKMTETIGAYTIFLYARLQSNLRSMPSLVRSVATTFFPHPQRIITSLRTLSSQQRLIAGSIITFIVIVPLFFIKFTQNKTTLYITENTNSQETSSTTASATQKNNDPTSTHIERAYTLHTDNTLHTLISLRGEIYAIAPQTITHITNTTTKKTFTVPKIYGTVIDAVAMNDLNMIILRTDTGAIISFTPQGSTKFVKNKIAFPAGLSIDAMTVYRTYLYFFDSNADDIYRYPRNTGGFGSAVDWLSDTTDFTTLTDVIIDGTIYTANVDGKLLSFFNRKQISAPIVTLRPELHADVLFSADEITPLFILDRSAHRIIALDKKTNTVKINVTNDDFATVRDFTVNERLLTITALLDNGIVTTYKY